MEAACTNPARLEGGSAQLDPILGFPWWRGGYAQGIVPEANWRMNGKFILTRFVRVPGRLSGGCVRGSQANYLAVHVNTNPRTPFDRELTAVSVIGDDSFPDWGFRIIDIAIVHGDLLRLVLAQSAAWRAHNRYAAALFPHSSRHGIVKTRSPQQHLAGSDSPCYQD